MKRSTLSHRDQIKKIERFEYFQEDCMCVKYTMHS